MRCKNCGSENNDNLYICQNCGSPLYDENNDSDTKAINPDELDKFNSMTRSRSSQPPAGKGKNDDSGNNSGNNSGKDKKNQQMIAVIIILAVLLVAIIIGIVVAVAGSNSDNKDKEDSSISSSLPEEDETTDQKLENSTTKESTTEKSTSKTTLSTTTTTTTTTQAVKFTVTLSCTDGGEVEGDGEYSSGEAVTVIARPDDGYDFDGWYSAGSKVSDNTKYKFTVTSDKNLEAKFIPVGEDFDVINGVDE